MAYPSLTPQPTCYGVTQKKTFKSRPSHYRQRYLALSYHNNDFFTLDLSTFDTDKRIHLKDWMQKVGEKVGTWPVLYMYNFLNWYWSTMSIKEIKTTFVTWNRYTNVYWYTPLYTRWNQNCQDPVSGDLPKTGEPNGSASALLPLSWVHHF